uniref:ribonuclease H n=1 Tax=Geotrypetes seraphini TaxID=260995 RepID=A0A6P8QGU0_GEOSA|nr:uncharacterized protein LOC117358235 [Geotrypetes seraphini]
MMVSPLAVIPKKEPGKFRLIHNLSRPVGSSVNDGIPRDLCTVRYSSVDCALRLILRAGRGALLAKVDIESAFRLLPVHPQSYPLLGFRFDGAYFYDRCLPMGCSISCSYFEMFSSFLHWVVVQRAGLDAVVHYLDDFLFIGPADSDDCSRLKGAFESMAAEFGIPLARDKSEGPVSSLVFLGIELDSENLVTRLPVRSGAVRQYGSLAIPSFIGPARGPRCVLEVVILGWDIWASGYPGGGNGV